MGEVIEFFAPMRRPPTATGANGKRVDRPSGRVYDSPELSRARETIDAAIAPYRPPQPITGPVGVELRWCYPLKGKHRQGEPYTSKPDIDNTRKVVYDALAGLGFIEDDRFICQDRGYQAWWEPSGLYVKIWKVDTR